MLRKTIMLFVKATVIGILINFGLDQMPSGPVSANGDIAQQNETTLVQPAPSQATDLSIN